MRLLLLALAALLLIFILTGSSSCSSLENKNGKSDSSINAQIQSINLGATEDEVRSVLGKPNETQEMNTGGYRNDCWYYGSSNGWQLCFDNGLLSPHHEMTLSTKNHY